MISQRIFKWCMVGAALILAGVGVYFLAMYVTASTALGAIARAMWIAYCTQLGLLATVLAYAAGHPRGISRQIVTVLAFMPMMSTVMLFWFAASRAGAILLGIAAALMLMAALAWPARIADEDAPPSAQALKFPGGPRAP